MDDDSDAKMILTPPTRQLKETTRGSSYYVAEHRPARSESLQPHEAVDLAQNRPLWRLMSTYGATHS